MPWKSCQEVSWPQEAASVALARELVKGASLPFLKATRPTGRRREGACLHRPLHYLLGVGPGAGDGLLRSQDQRRRHRLPTGVEEGEGGRGFGVVGFGCVCLEFKRVVDRGLYKKWR